MKLITCCIPQTDRLALRAVLILLMLGFVSAGCKWLYDGIANGQWFLLAVAAFLIVLAAGLRFMKPWARTISVVVLWLVIVILQFAMLPLGAGAHDAIVEGRMPDAMEMAMKIYPLIGIALLFLHVLGKYKAEFRPRP